MIGEVIFTGSDGYKEIVMAEQGTTKLVECTSLKTSPLYRLEWVENGHPYNIAYYTWPAASASFDRKNEITTFFRCEHHKNTNLVARGTSYYCPACRCAPLGMLGPEA